MSIRRRADVAWWRNMATDFQLEALLDQRDLLREHRRDLLDACNAALRLIERLPGRATWDFNDVENVLKAAVAKAEGR